MAALALAAYAAHSLFGLGGDGAKALFENWIFNAIIVAGAALALLRGLTQRSERPVWLTLGAGLAAWAAGEIVYTLSPSSVGGSAFPSTSDMLWLVYYPAGFITLGLIVRRRVRAAYASLWLDGVVGTLAVGAVVAQFVFPPIVASTGASGSSVVGDLAYPVGDSLLMAFVIGLLALTGWRPGRQLALLTAGFAVGSAADCWSLYSQATGQTGSTPLDMLWPAAALLLGAAAWLRGDTLPAIRLTGRRLIAFPVAFAAVALVLLVVNGVTPLHGAAYGLAVAALAGAVLRMTGTFVENARLVANSQTEALTDVLTGLANRRRLMADLELALADAGIDRTYRLALFDLNGFKAFNDRFGHPAGDELLATIAGRLRAAVGEDGVAYRLGGDEFCALYRPGASTSDVAVASARAALSDRAHGLHVTASYGVVEVPREARTVTEALQLADERLYAHKRSHTEAIKSARAVAAPAQVEVVA